MLVSDFAKNIDNEIFTYATVSSFQESGYRLSITKATMLAPDKKPFQAIWFNQKFIGQYLKSEKVFYLRGKLGYDEKSKMYQLQVSEYELLSSTQETKIIVPIYPLTAGIYQKSMRSIAKQIITKHLPKESLPEYITKQNKLVSLSQAITQLHFPDGNRQAWKESRKRIVFEELFAIQLQVARHYYLLRRGRQGSIFGQESSLLTKYYKILPYQLTNAQKRVITEITIDLSSGKCMNRLLQGDVGSGKTEVAIASAILGIDSGFQVSLMAPTEVLAQQHFNKLTQKLAPLGITVTSLLGKHTAKEKENIYKDIRSGTAQLIIGTHAIFQKNVIFKTLGLVIIDEQHRFGVLQRELLIAKGDNPHILIMTATPIPRSLSLTVFGDLDRSIIDEMPPGRIPIKTSLVREKNTPILKNFVKEILAKNQQVFVVYPLIEESEKLDLKDALNGFDKWKSDFDAVGLLHGRMTPTKKEAIINDFSSGEIKILISTTVIEVGIDIPQATVMIIENAHRFGLSQLHQLRGRVGRGGDNSWCFLISNTKSGDSKKRLQALIDSTDGFKLAEIDLQLRGAGDYLGTRQSGLPGLNLTDLVKDNDLIQLARKTAFEIIYHDEQLTNPENKLLKNFIENSLGPRLN